MTARTVLQAPDITRALTRISHEILESVPASSIDNSGIANSGIDDLIVLGIPTRGVVLARRLGALLREHAGADVPVGSLDVTMYRDDLAHNPTRTPARTEVPSGGIDGKAVILVDDVLYSGRTIRAALDALSAIGRPKYVRLATLVDRGHRELPIRPDFVGKNLPTSEGERIHVRLTEIDGVEEVTIES